jgi:4-hydroxy-4-methyl-2-oxoglutarate aldolase
MTNSPKLLLSDQILRDAASSSSASIHEAAGKIGALPASLRALSANMRICATALPIRCPAGDNLWLHRAIYAACPGEVLVVDTGGAGEFGYWGEVMTVAAQQCALAGLVIDGGVRDSQRLIELSFPVFSNAVCIQGTGKNPRGDGAIGEPVRLGGVVVRRGDLIVGDADGLVAIPCERASAVVAEALARDKAEQGILGRLRAGESTVAVYNLPRE